MQNVLVYLSESWSIIYELVPNLLGQPTWSSLRFEKGMSKSEMVAWGVEQFMATSPGSDS